MCQRPQEGGEIRRQERFDERVRGKSQPKIDIWGQIHVRSLWIAVHENGEQRNLYEVENIRSRGLSPSKDARWLLKRQEIPSYTSFLESQFLREEYREKL